jgi:hypothetical protein
LCFSVALTPAFANKALLIKLELRHRQLNASFFFRSWEGSWFYQIFHSSAERISLSSLFPHLICSESRCHFLMLENLYPWGWYCFEWSHLLLQAFFVCSLDKLNLLGCIPHLAVQQLSLKLLLSHSKVFSCSVCHPD